MMKRLDWRQRGVVAICILIALFCLIGDLPAADASAIASADTAAITRKKSKAKSDDDKKKKKKKKKSDDDDADGTLVKGARPTPPFIVPPIVAGKKYVYFIAIGDWGTGSPAQRHIAGLMNAKASRDSLHFVLLLGDNFYSSGGLCCMNP